MTAHAEIENTGATASDGRLRFAVLDTATGRELAHAEVAAPLEANQTAKFQADVSYSAARLWDLDSPQLYKMKAEWTGGSEMAARMIDFGFRWFAPEGIGTNALFRLNGRRVLGGIVGDFWSRRFGRRRLPRPGRPQAGA